MGRTNAFASWEALQKFLKGINVLEITFYHGVISTEYVNIINIFHLFSDTSILISSSKLPCLKCMPSSDKAVVALQEVRKKQTAKISLCIFYLLFDFAQGWQKFSHF